MPVIFWKTKKVLERMGKIEYIIVIKKIEYAKEILQSPFEVLGYLRNPIFFRRIFVFTKEIKKWVLEY